MHIPWAIFFDVIGRTGKTEFFWLQDVSQITCVLLLYSSSREIDMCIKYKYDWLDCPFSVNFGLYISANIRTLKPASALCTSAQIRGEFPPFYLFGGCITLPRPQSGGIGRMNFVSYLSTVIAGL